MKKLALPFVLAALFSLPICVAAQAEQSLIETGEKLYKARCASCHTFEEGEGHRVGPNLWGIFGKEAAAAEDFRRYSSAMRNSGFTWTEETMDSYLENPRQFMPGTTMMFVGLRKDEDRDALIAFLTEATQ